MSIDLTEGTHCSFCGVKQSEAYKLIAGKHGTYICDNCTKTAFNLIFNNKDQIKTEKKVEKKKKRLNYCRLIFIHRAKNRFREIGKFAFLSKF